MSRRGGTGKVIDLLDFEQNRMDDVLANNLKTRIRRKMNNVPYRPGEEIVKTGYVSARCQLGL
jgi:hypothetical protein